MKADQICFWSAFVGSRGGIFRAFIDSIGNKCTTRIGLKCTTLSGTEGGRMSENEFFRIKFGDLAESCYICSKEV